MAIIRDWVADAAEEIHHEYAAGFFRSQIEAVIRRHCPFKQDVVYVEASESAAFEAGVERGKEIYADMDDVGPK
jgi:hypothetical protein